MSDSPQIDIDYVAKLARIALTDDEKERFASQLSSILEYIDKLDELDTENVAPIAHPHHATNVWQDDAVSSEMSNEDALSNAPDQRNGMIVVPKIVE